MSTPVDPSRMEEFASLYGANQRSIVLYLTSLLPSQTDVDDVLQEAGVVLWREFATFEPGTNFRAWAFRVAFNQVRAWRKRQQRDRLLFSEEFISAISEELNSAPGDFERRAEWMHECIERLPVHHRELLAYRYQQGLPIETLAEKFGRSADAVYRLLSRVRNAVHECIDAKIRNEEPA